MEFEEIENGYYFSECEEFNEKVAVKIWELIKEKGFAIQSSDEFDVLRIEIWMDSGSLIIFPSDWAFQNRTDKFGVKVFVQHWLSVWQQADKRCENDDEFDTIIDEFQLSMANKIQNFIESEVRSLGMSVVIYECGESKIKSF